MNPDSFEQKLARRPLREVPQTWRGKILSAARKAEASRQSSPALRRSLLATLNQQLSTFLWPHPRAWAGLAAVWLLILAANVASRDRSPTVNSRVATPSPQMREMLREQEQLLAELFESVPAADRPKAVPSRPQSFYRNEFLNA